MVRDLIKIVIQTSKGGLMRGSCVIFSSNTDNGLNAGSFYLNANNATSNANANIDSGDLLHKTSTTSPCLQVGRTKKLCSIMCW